MNCNYGIDMTANYNVGSVSMIDSSISSCSAGVYTQVTGNGEGSLVIDNFNVGSGVTTVKSSKNNNALLTGSVAAGETWVMEMRILKTISLAKCTKSIDPPLLSLVGNTSPRDSHNMRTTTLAKL